ncbi:hypothetical protein T492DRAFT_832398 [Pavlovales sp. CCMP2436]|nr:hypothetical protein T492DRAFT_832398 [Pavlovales sp. CCMP2436]
MRRAAIISRPLENMRRPASVPNARTSCTRVSGGLFRQGESLTADEHVAAAPGLRRTPRLRGVGALELALIESKQAVIELEGKLARSRDDRRSLGEAAAGAAVAALSLATDLEELEDEARQMRVASRRTSAASATPTHKLARPSPKGQGYDTQGETTPQGEHPPCSPKESSANPAHSAATVLLMAVLDTVPVSAAAAQKEGEGEGEGEGPSCGGAAGGGGNDTGGGARIKLVPKSPPTPSPRTPRHAYLGSLTRAAAPPCHAPPRKEVHGDAAAYRSAANAPRETQNPEDERGVWGIVADGVCKHRPSATAAASAGRWGDCARARMAAAVDCARVRNGGGCARV